MAARFLPANLKEYAIKMVLKLGYIDSVSGGVFAALRLSLLAHSHLKKSITFQNPRYFEKLSALQICTNSSLAKKSQRVRVIPVGTWRGQPSGVK